MAVKYSAFSYKSGNSFVHKCPAWIKILFIPFFSICTFCLPPEISCGLVGIQFILAFYLQFSIKEQFADLKPVIYYAFLLTFTKAVSFAAQFFLNRIDAVNFSLAQFFDYETFAMLLKLFCIMQLSSIIFKTSTSLEIRGGIGIIESSIRRFFHLKPENSFTDTISMFVNFIPMVSKNWQQSERAWKARCGKKSLKMYIVLIPVLFSVGMKQAYNTARAVSARSR